MMTIKPRVAFVCIHNSCRSQMAEAISKLVATEDFIAFSAGTEIKSQIDPIAIEVIKEIYSYDMTEEQYPKIINDIPEVDILITMGCNVNCPFVPCKYREDWGLEDPSGKGKDEYYKLARIIEDKILKLKKETLPETFF